MNSVGAIPCFFCGLLLMNTELTRSERTDDDGKDGLSSILMMLLALGFKIGDGAGDWIRKIGETFGQ